MTTIACFSYGVQCFLFLVLSRSKKKKKKNEIGEATSCYSASAWVTVVRVFVQKKRERMISMAIREPEYRRRKKEI
jgi:hypothetical protein